MFEPSEKIICIDDKFPPSGNRVYAYMKNFPTKGKIYTVRDLIPAQDYKGKDTCAVLLLEITNPDQDPKNRGEFGFSTARFRRASKQEIAASIAKTESINKTSTA